MERVRPGDYCPSKVSSIEGNTLGNLVSKGDEEVEKVWLTDSSASKRSSIEGKQPR